MSKELKVGQLYSYDYHRFVEDYRSRYVISNSFSSTYAGKKIIYFTLLYPSGSTTCTTQDDWNKSHRDNADILINTYKNWWEAVEDGQLFIEENHPKKISNCGDYTEYCKVYDRRKPDDEQIFIRKVNQ